MTKHYTPLPLTDGHDHTAINNNLDAIEEALEDTLSRSGELPNAMGADIDMDGNDLLNVGTIDATNFTVGGSDPITQLTGYVDEAEGFKDEAALSETNAHVSEVEAEASASEAASSATDTADIKSTLVALGTINGTIDANLPMSNYKVTGMGNGTASGDGVNKSQLDAVGSTVSSLSDDSMLLDGSQPMTSILPAPLGITFDSGTNVLDFYEEGSWTPSLTASSGSVTYYSNQGSFTRIGNYIHIAASIYVNTSSLSGTLYIEGLPFLNNQDVAWSSVPFTTASNLTGGVVDGLLIGEVTPLLNRMAIKYVNDLSDGITMSYLQGEHLDTTFASFRFSGGYTI